MIKKNELPRFAKDKDLQLYDGRLCLEMMIKQGIELPEMDSESRLNYRTRILDIHPEYRDILRNAGYTKLTGFFEETWRQYKKVNSTVFQ